MTFGYNANLSKDTISGRIAEFAENLLADLQAERAYDETDQQRPIIFICHSLGGIVVKRALSVAHGRPIYNTLLNATRSIIFMATPHRGSDKASWGGLAGRILGCAKLFTTQTTKLLEELTPFSDILEDYNVDFVNISPTVQIISFFEKEPYVPIGLIVDEWSAKMEVPSETAKIAVSANHQNICRFESEESHEFQTFWRQLRLLVFKAVSGGSRRVGETSLATVTAPAELTG
ncbi:hypothetical protein F4820DRAFT_408714 [Hypoxylon rubiginosum]|uniref:Uncharacterized protein n=1 Tax=Hypoxylon rubiginosum TaxID=110542 RepID=A0ACB9ZAA4_9PEZI|nr:hypothetical protein F4820DRAFT_408714 [Hypoxylon rubiginosum]